MIHNTAVLTLSEGWRKQSSALKICVAESKEKGFGNCFPKPNLVGMTGFEPATSWSQTKRATNCATSRLFYSQHLFPKRLACKASGIPIAPHLDLYCERVYYSRYLCESQALYKVFLELGEKHCLSPSLLFFSFGFFDFVGIKDAQGNDRTIVARLALGAPAANLINDFLGGE